jgi:hypothetical protein
MYVVKMPSCSMILQSFTKTGTGVQVIFRSFLGNLEGCNSVITADRNS